MADDESLYTVHLEEQAEALVADLVTLNTKYYDVLVESGMPSKEVNELLAFYCYMRISKTFEDMTRGFTDPE